MTKEELRQQFFELHGRHWSTVPLVYSEWLEQRPLLSSEAEKGEGQLAKAVTGLIEEITQPGYPIHSGTTWVWIDKCKAALSSPPTAQEKQGVEEVSSAELEIRTSLLRRIELLESQNKELEMRLANPTTPPVYTYEGEEERQAARANAICDYFFCKEPVPAAPDKGEETINRQQAESNADNLISPEELNAMGDALSKNSLWLKWIRQFPKLHERWINLHGAFYFTQQIEAFAESEYRRVMNENN